MLSSHLRIQTSKQFVKPLHFFFFISSRGSPCSLITTSNPSPQLLQSSPSSLPSRQLPLHSTSRHCHSVSTTYAGNSCHSCPFTLAHGKVRIEEGIDKHLRNAAAKKRCSESGPARQALIHQLAINLSWGPLTLDLFATASDSLTPSFYSRFAEPVAEQSDAMIQPDWGTSQFPQCGIVNSELIFAFTPESLLPSTPNKDFSDQIRAS